MKKFEPMDEMVCAIDKQEESNDGCKVRRQIEDYLERRRYQDELGTAFEKDIF